MATYNPQDHIVQNKGTGTLGKPVDARSWWTDGIEERPFADIPEALAYFDMPVKREGSFLVYIGQVPYWFKGGVEDVHFVPFLTSTVDLTPVQNSTNPISSGWAYDLQLAAENATGITYTSGSLYAGAAELKLNLDYFFGVWQAGYYQKGWIVLDTARKSVYKAKLSHESATAPVPGDNWELLFSIPLMDAVPASNSDNYVRSGYLFEKEKEHLYYRGGKVYNASGVEVLKVDTTAVAASTNAVSSGYVFSQQLKYAYWVNGVLRDYAGNPIDLGITEYTHPTTHPATMIVEDTYNRFVTDAQIAYWNDHYTQAEVTNLISGIAGGLIWKGEVNAFADLATAYPAPENNWTVQVASENKVYKYDTATGAWEYLFGSIDPLVTQTLDGNMSKEDKIKLDGIETGATKNQSDSYLLSRANHTGSQAMSTVTGLQTNGDGTMYLANDGTYKTVVTAGIQDIAYEPLSTGAVTVNYSTSPNWKGPASGVASITAANIPDGGDLRIELLDCAGETIPIGGSGNVDHAGADITELTLPASGDCYVLVNNTGAYLKWSVTGQSTGTGTTEGNKSAEAPSSAILFTNPFGHIRSSALSGSQTFTASGSILTESVQPYTADGTATIAFDFAHYFNNNEALQFASGNALPAGEYDLYFSNRGTAVAISIATRTAIAGGGTVELTTPTSISVASNNYNEMTVSWQ